MLPILSLLVCVACLVWWGVVAMQGVLVNSKVASLRSDLELRKSAHANILAQMADMRERQSQLDQLAAYKRGCHKYGALLAKLAEVIPAEVQLTVLTIPEPPPQMLHDPKNPKRPPLLGPTNDTETVSVVLTGRAARDTTIVSFMESLEGASFTNRLGRVAVRSVQQEPQPLKKGEARLLAFELECRAADRRFAK